MKKLTNVLIGSAVVFTIILGVHSSTNIAATNDSVSETELADSLTDCYWEYIKEAGTKYNIAPELIEALIYSESNCNVEYNGENDSIGLMAISSDLRNSYIDYDVNYYDPYKNIMTGSEILYNLFKKYEDVTLVVMCYTEGETEETIERYNNLEDSDATSIVNLSDKLQIKHEQ